MANFNLLNSAFTLRPNPLNGRNKSEALNDSMQEVLHDFAEVYDFVNNTVIPILNGLGRPGTYSDFDVVTLGLDGTTLITDKDWSDVTDPYFYNSVQGRPNTVSESVVKVKSDLDSVFNSINSINARLGTQSTQTVTSNPATLAELENQVNYYIGVTQTLQSNDNNYLTASGIANAISTQAIDPASFNIGASDITSNAGISPTDISGVDLTTDYTGWTGGLPATYDMQDTVLRLKEWVEAIGGDTFTSYSNSGISGDSLDTHRDKVGTGTASATNPHGLDVSDLNDGSDILGREVRLGSFKFHSSGLNGNMLETDGYEYINKTYTLTRVAGTVMNHGAATKEFGVYRDRSAVIELIGSLSLTTSEKYDMTESLSITTVQANDLLFVSGIGGDGTNCRLTVWGTPA